MAEPPKTRDPDVFSVAQLTGMIKGTLEQVFPSVWVRGEIGDLSRPRSGHFYFTLKDDQAQIRAVIWRSTAAWLRHELSDGLHIVCRGELDVYPPRGGYQLVIRQLEPLGVGALQLRLKKLQERLSAEGLFAAERKQALPRFPRRIAVITSPSGAAVRDFLEVMRRRWRGVRVSIMPVRVQGEGAAGEVARAIHACNRLQPKPDVLVVTRGGGSLEDLWCFNEEAVVRAIHRSSIPVVSAIGHEIDVTLADLAADVRALTPTEAAERVAPSSEELERWLGGLQQRLTGALSNRAAAARARLEALAAASALRRPLDRTHQLARRLDDLQIRCERAIRNRHQRAADRLARASGQLDSLSPLGVLARGYSLTLDEQDALIHSTEQLVVGQRIITRLKDGEAASRVEHLGDQAARED